MPKFEIPAIRFRFEDFFHGVGLSGTVAGMRVKSMFGLKVVTFRWGGSISCLKARRVLMMDAIPAAASACPILVFTAPIKSGFCRGCAYALVMALTSIGSPTT